MNARRRSFQCKSHRAKAYGGEGYILVFALVFFGIFLLLGSAFLGSITTFAKSTRIAAIDAQALLLAQAGIDKAIYELNTSSSYTGENNTSLAGGTFTTAVAATGSIMRITSTGTYAGRSATVRVDAGIDTTQVSFSFGVQVGEGGVVLDNNARIEGNLYANGSIVGSNGAVITGSATAASTSDISSITIHGAARAQTLTNCTVGGNAIYQTLSSCPVAGTKTATSTYAPTLPFPIPVSEIDEWKTTASGGGTTGTSVTVTGTQSLGPRKIAGNLNVNGTLILTGPVWVTGTVTLSNGASIVVSSSLGNTGTVLISDSLITLSNNATFAGNGNPGSYPMLLSTRSNATAISLSNGADGVILYAPYGTIAVSNNASANQITAYRLTISNNAVVSYLTGLADANFTSGPGGSWAFVPGTYALTP